MSRIGKKPVPIPDGVDLDVVGGKITFRGAKCTRELDTMGRVHVTVKGRDLIFGAAGSDPQSLAFWGTYRVLANNIVVGLTSGFTKTLEISGVGYKASVAGRNLELSLGFSHPVVYPIPDGVDITVDKSIVVIKGGDKQQVGQVAAEIRRFRPPEPYKGKGIKYSNEVIIRKAGKTSKK